MPEGVPPPIHLHPFRGSPRKLRPRAAVGTSNERHIVRLAALLDHILPDPFGTAAALLATFGSAGAVLTAREECLLAVPGMTHPAARLLRAAHALSLNALRERVTGRDVLAGWTDLERYLQATLAYRTREVASGIFLGPGNRLIDEEILCEGEADILILHPRQVARRAIEVDATGLILAHNHPSGDPTPSKRDIETTRRIADALLAVDVVLHDHVIVGAGRVVSMRKQRIGW